MQLYTNTAGDNLVKKYIDKGGEVITIEEGCLLGYGLAILRAEGFQTTIIKEKYLNAWSSAYTKRSYNKLPKKYLKYIN